MRGWWHRQAEEARSARRLLGPEARMEAGPRRRGWTRGAAFLSHRMLSLFCRSLPSLRRHCNTTSRPLLPFLPLDAGAGVLLPAHELHLPRPVAGAAQFLRSRLPKQLKNKLPLLCSQTWTAGRLPALARRYAPGDSDTTWSDRISHFRGEEQGKGWTVLARPLRKSPKKGRPGIDPRAVGSFLSQSALLR